MKEKVYGYLKTIPRGRVATYGQIAVWLGNRRLARAVGNILHQNPNPGSIPCNRVVNSKGQVADRFAFGGGAAQRKLLEQEGIRFEPNGTVDLQKYGMGGFGMAINGCQEGKATPRLSEVKCPRCGQYVEVFVIMGGKAGQTGTLTGDETCACGHVLPAGSYESEYEK